MTKLQQWVDGFNKGDMKAFLAACADQASITDDFPPHAWFGSGACAKWAADYDAEAKKDEITDGNVTLGKPRHLDVSGDYAYVVTPVTYVYKEKGKTITETGSSITIALHKDHSGWRLTAWTWSQGYSKSTP